MYTQDDLIDLLMSHFAPQTGAAAALKELAGRPFLTEYDIKKRLTGGARTLTLDEDAIVSPLAADWLILNGIEIIRR